MTIQPAFTPDEWARLEAEGPLDPKPDGEYYEWRVTSREDLKAIAAEVLHGQPFGFTWEDVDALRDMHQSADGEWGVGRGDDERFAWMLNLADRIAALLPPRP